MLDAKSKVERMSLTSSLCVMLLFVFDLDALFLFDLIVPSPLLVDVPVAVEVAEDDGALIDPT